MNDYTPCTQDIHAKNKQTNECGPYLFPSVGCTRLIDCLQNKKHSSICMNISWRIRICRGVCAERVHDVMVCVMGAMRFKHSMSRRREVMNGISQSLLLPLTMIQIHANSMVEQDMWSYLQLLLRSWRNYKICDL